jgi:GT2 family glycosyltransferase
MIDVGIVILNWNTRDLLRTCLQTVAASIGVDGAPFAWRAIIVDNASTDGSADMVDAEFVARDARFQLIRSPINNGYSYGNNLGLRALGWGDDGVRSDAPRYAVLLNPDTEVPPDAFARMTAFMDSQPDIGAAGPMLILPDGTLDKACRRSFPTPLVSLYHFAGLGKLFPHSPRFARYNMTYLPPDQESEVDSVVGAYMQVRREAIAAVGLLDEVFFMYGEDIDWAKRIKSAGWRVLYHPRVVVKHVKRAASRQSQRAQFEFWRAMLIFYRKHYRAQTPLWLHGLVMLALVVKGGRGLWGELRQPTHTAVTTNA